MQANTSEQGTQVNINVTILTKISSKYLRVETGSSGSNDSNVRHFIVLTRLWRKGSRTV